ncbi:MAG: adenylate/guanylate cyclase domain-containing protein, partial [Alphaproteobacteria bacterium]|nr:adenylate/guanylate cyclase domain-containing protein [Alphaproteobacteria bacterium]
MICPNCDSENADAANFCAQCGSKLERTCPACSAVVGADHRFCQSCGQALEPTAAAPKTPSAERRQITVLFADLSGFTRLTSELDAEETHALLNCFFAAVDQVVEHYGGSIDKHIGDAVMAVFGAPVAHTNDPERAVRAALDIHGAVAELEPPLDVHIGIASGQVVASGTGSAQHQEYTVT